MIGDDAVMLTTEARARIAESYLHHIIIALEAEDRAAPFRDFLDNWFAYETVRGHLTTGGRPIWFNNPCAKRHKAALAAMHFVSRNAAAILADASSAGSQYAKMRLGKGPSIRLMVDHAIPLRVLRQTMFEDSRLKSIDALRAFLRQNYRLGVVTFEENARLSSLVLVSAMPGDWSGADPFARYAAAGIERVASI